MLYKQALQDHTMKVGFAVEMLKAGTAGTVELYSSFTLLAKDCEEDHISKPVSST